VVVSIEPCVPLPDTTKEPDITNPFVIFTEPDTSSVAVGDVVPIPKFPNI